MLITKKINKYSKAFLFEDTQYIDIYEILKYHNNFIVNPNQYSPYDIRFEECQLSQYYNNNIIDKYIDLSLDKNNLYNIQNKLRNSNLHSFIVYTDGSVVNIGTQNVSTTFGFMIYDLNMNLIDTFISTYEHWVSALRAELFAILSTLIVLPNNSTVNIYTDSEIIVNNFNIYKNYGFLLTARQKLKIRSQNQLWMIIMEIIVSLSLIINIHKVDAHSSNVFNNIIDKEVKAAHDNVQHMGINLKGQSIDNFIWYPMWKNINIEQNLRKFLTLLTNTKNLENFLNLNRNYKYRITEVDWDITFYLLQGYQGTMFTDFKETKLKRKKIKLLIEEIPHIHQL
jgi:ribonuclease HI